MFYKIETGCYGRGVKMNNRTFWKISKTEHPRFPFRLTIARGAEIILDLYVQDRWPGSGRNIFCIRPASREPLPMIFLKKRVNTILRLLCWLIMIWERWSLKNRKNVRGGIGLNGVNYRCLCLCHNKIY